MTRKGLPQKYIRLGGGITKKAWRLYRKSKGKTKRSKSSRKTSKGGSGRMAKRSLTVPIALVGGVLAGVVPAVNIARTGDYTGAMDFFIAAYTGFSMEQGNFNAERLRWGLLPLIGGALIHKFVGGRPLNVNRALGRAGVPILRI